MSDTVLTAHIVAGVSGRRPQVKPHPFLSSAQTPARAIFRENGKKMAGKNIFARACFCHPPREVGVRPGPGARRLMSDTVPTPHIVAGESGRRSQEKPRPFLASPQKFARAVFRENGKKMMGKNILPGPVFAIEQSRRSQASGEQAWIQGKGLRLAEGKLVLEACRNIEHKDESRRGFTNTLSALTMQENGPRNTRIPTNHGRESGFPRPKLHDQTVRAQGRPPVGAKPPAWRPFVFV
jgi:hypothetical protein